ncbi:MAG: hypothetical protein HRT36_05330 [Alphaproteobacteria bacterium]|nr:hypothetical protein [Alphaproteobacteria bacterium]
MAVQEKLPEDNRLDVDDKPPISINQRFTIYPGLPIPHFHAAPAMAYKVVDNENPDESYHGLVCDPKLHPRLSIIDRLNMLAKTNTNILSPTAWSVLDWEEESRQCPVLIMHSGRLVPFSFKNLPSALTDEAVVNIFMRNCIELLTKFEEQRLTHRAIHLDNLFYYNELKRRIILGECVSTPPGLAQSKLYDTIDSALSVPLGKGADSISDDIYALGVVSLSMLNGCELGKGISDEELIARKMMYGSFEALHDPKIRLGGTMENCMRKMLHDDRGERATTTEMMTWLNGQNFRLKSERPRKRSSKPFTINNQNFFTARDLAKGMHAHWDTSTKVAMSENLRDWLQNNLSETMITLNYDRAIKDFEGYSVENQHRILGRVLLALHHTGPIRYRSFCATIDGITRLISHFVHNDKARQIFREMMGSGILEFWFELHNRDNEKKSAWNFKIYEQFKSYTEELRKESPIEGLNLLVYEFNHDLPCQSKRFERYFVYQPHHLLPAIESILKNDNDVDSLIDYQMICFLKSRYSRSVSKEVRSYMINSVREEACVAEATILTKLQNDFYPNREFPRICHKLCELLEPAVKRHHSRSVRRVIRQEMQKEAEKGYIHHLVQIISDKNMIENDQVNFNLARAEYASLLQEIGFVDFNLKNLREMVARIGGDISASVSGILASIITLSYVSYWSLFQ